MQRGDLELGLPHTRGGSPKNNNNNKSTFSCYSRRYPSGLAYTHLTHCGRAEGIVKQCLARKGLLVEGQWFFGSDWHAAAAGGFVGSGSAIEMCPLICPIDSEKICGIALANLAEFLACVLLFAVAAGKPNWATLGRKAKVFSH